MADNTRFFLGYGERLTHRVAPPGGGNTSELAYSFEDAVARLAPMLEETTSSFANLPALATPDNEAVGVLTLHPQWMAKTSHPRQLLDSYELRQVGSPPVAVTPDRWTRIGPPTEMASSELFVAGTRAAFERWANDLDNSPQAINQQIRRLERVRAPIAAERVRGEVDTKSEDEVLLEVVLHASEDASNEYILSGFEEYSRTLGARPVSDRRLYAGGLCFLPVVAAPSVVDELAQFAFLRVARPMPRMRRIPSMERSTLVPGLAPAPLPDQDAVDVDLRIAVFDGGLATGSPLGRWATAHEGDSVGGTDPALLSHGHDVTSAVLFGSLLPGQPAPRPYAVVDHFRVLDDEAGSDPYELYEVLRRIDDVLRTRRYGMFNLSIGPYLPVEDDEVHPWTALLDQYLADGNTLASLAVGNTGEQVGAASEGRIQVPSDCVNGLSVGAADSVRSDWKRASYSSFGPGRSPGVVKPDVLHFGGHGTEPFLVYDRQSAPALSQTCGTSFAAPAALRVAAGLRAHFSERVSPLALKAMLVHSAERSEHDKSEVGWGRVGSDVADIAVCGDGMVRVIYQGELTPSQYLRAPIPLPQGPLRGMVGIEATFCYATPTDPQDPGSYTRSGLEVTFRPHSGKFATEDSTVAKTASFFKKGAFATEQALRNDAQK